MNYTTVLEIVGESRVVTQSQIQLGTDKKTNIFTLFWPENPSK